MSCVPLGVLTASQYVRLRAPANYTAVRYGQDSDQSSSHMTIQGSSSSRSIPTINNEISDSLGTRMSPFSSHNTMQPHTQSAGNECVGGGLPGVFLIQSIADSLVNWPEMSEIELFPLFDRLIRSSDSDDTTGQRYRTEAKSCIPALAGILDAAGKQTVDYTSQLLVQCLTSLRFITKGDPYNITIATNLDVLISCRNIMRHFAHDASVQRYCCMIYRSLTFNRADNQRLVVEIGVVPLIYKAIAKFPDSPEVPAAAFMCIQNITWLVESNRNSIVTDGGLLIIIDSMRAHSDNVDVQKWGCGALQNLACCFQCTSLLIQKGSLRLVLQAMATHLADPIVQNYGLGVLRNISYLKTNRVSVADSGAFETAITSLVNYSADLDVQNSAYSFLLNSVIDVPENKAKILRFDALLPAIFRARARFRDDKRFADKVAVLLDQLSDQGKSHYIVLERDIEPLSLFEVSLRRMAPLSPSDDTLLGRLGGSGLSSCDPRAHTNHVYTHATPLMSGSLDECVLNGHCGHRERDGVIMSDLIERETVAQSKPGDKEVSRRPSASMHGIRMGVCDVCKGAYLNSLVLATKAKGERWLLHRVCGRRCHSAMIKAVDLTHNGGNLATFQPASAEDEPLIPLPA
ncbi:hypothetical protein SARC_02298 [Sphaeroforma arctica JP610]|uniref:Armadillo repeat-containing domain-containing protein n=1 Tax=Sphaeroforma arctica JP610 TaxID=667725 RepID=A0A0L0G932_9EUKA|nr:hypothetical protein SARC_02298 [Sphaeroforma arctica JP610]KNC85537.1 hypothetical protein SARC_02298 [Sphaeroforma arctica JP610]|eukprot:XP_014159439.1 hypothetical protein SARC_02298 [Sphaeroforma arctica JP610]